MKIALCAALLSIIIAGVMIAGSCGTPSVTTTATPAPGNTTTPGGNFEITIQGEAFSPPTINVAAGTTVIWTNRNSVAHTVTSDTGEFDSGLFAEGDTFSFTFAESGVYEYHCTIHPNMRGTVTVE